MDGATYGCFIQRTKELGAKAGTTAETLPGRPYDWGEGLHVFRDTILGISHRYRFSYLIDIALMLIAIGLLGRVWLPQLFWFVLGAVFMYSMTVIANLYLRRRFPQDEEAVATPKGSELPN